MPCRPAREGPCHGRSDRDSDVPVPHGTGFVKEGLDPPAGAISGAGDPTEPAEPGGDVEAEVLRLRTELDEAQAVAWRAQQVRSRRIRAVTAGVLALLTAIS